MKFVSKMSNHRIILRPGLQSNHLTGSPAVPTLFVQFDQGVAEVSNEELIDMMLLHPGYNRDFVKIEDGDTDPYEVGRHESEPAHVMSDVENGRVVNRTNTPVKQPDVKKMIDDRAMELAKEILPSLVEAVLAQQAAKSADTADAPAEEKPAAKKATTRKKAAK